MKRPLVRGRRFATAVGAVAAGVGGANATDAAVIFQNVDVDIPADMADYTVDLNSDATGEFDIQEFEGVTKVADLADATALVEDPGDGRTANLANGTLIGPGSAFSADGAVPSGGDALNGTEGGNPVGHFQVSDGPGFIGVKFDIAGNTHFGYVGYQGTGAENDASGNVFKLAYEDTPGLGVLAGSEVSIPEPTSLCLLAAGAAGLPRYRRRRLS